MPIHVRRALTKWGNGWGLRLTKKEVAALGIKPGQPVEAELRRNAARNPIDDLPSWSLGGRTDLDDAYDEDAVEEFQRGSRR